MLEDGGSSSPDGLADHYPAAMGSPQGEGWLAADPPGKGFNMA